MKKKQSVSLLAATLFFLFSIAGFGQAGFPKKYRKIQQYIERATRQKLTGVVVYIKTAKHGEWTAVSGYANRDTKQLLQPTDIFSMASIGKMYNAAAVLKLVEAGKLHLDDSITHFLPAAITDSLPNATAITIRHLLAHTSGLIDYESDTELSKRYLAGVVKLDTLSHINALRQYVYGKAALCKPGAQFHYSSTNYMLLAMIADSIVPEGHTLYLRKLIGQYGYANTWYRQTPPQKNIHYYGDLNQDEVAEDLTAQTFETTNWFMGDDGVYAPVAEAAHFLEDLLKGKILNQQLLKEMTTWNNDKKPDYGLGLMADKSFPYKFLMGHSGRGIGTTSDAYYFPKQDMTIVIFCNNGLRAAAPGFKTAYNKMRASIIKKLFLF